MSEFYGVGDDNESVATIHEALDQGVNFLDTADMYGPSPTNCWSGEPSPAARRSVLATKFAISAVRTAPSRGQRTPEYVLKAATTRFGASTWTSSTSTTSTVWIARAHRGDLGRHEVARGSRQGPLPGHLGGLLGQRSRRRTRCTRSRRCRASIRSGPRPRRRFLATCRALGIGFVAYSPLGRGFLTDESSNREGTQERDFRKSHPRFSGDAYEKNLQLVANLEVIAREKGTSVAQLALAWSCREAPTWCRYGHEAAKVAAREHRREFDRPERRRLRRPGVSRAAWRGRGRALPLVGHDHHQRLGVRKDHLATARSRPSRSS